MNKYIIINQHQTFTYWKQELSPLLIHPKKNKSCAPCHLTLKLLNKLKTFPDYWKY